MGYDVPGKRKQNVKINEVLWTQATQDIIQVTQSTVLVLSTK